jgi:sulfide:quinone oxidoreductase
MKPIVVSDILAVGEVPSPEEIAILAKAGFRSIIDNQPDGEVERLPGSSVIAIEAAKCGLGYAYAPISSRTPPPDELLEFARALERLPAPIYGFCYSGARSAAAMAFIMTREKNPDVIITEFAEAGHDVAALAPWLAEQRELHAPGAMAASKSGGESRQSGPAVRIELAPPEAKTKPAAPALPTIQGIVINAQFRGAGGFANVNAFTR